MCVLKKKTHADEMNIYLHEIGDGGVEFLIKGGLRRDDWNLTRLKQKLFEFVSLYSLLLKFNRQHFVVNHKCNHNNKNRFLFAMWSFQKLQQQKKTRKKNKFFLIKSLYRVHYILEIDWLDLKKILSKIDIFSEIWQLTFLFK